MIEFGPHKYGAKLSIDPEQLSLDPTLPIVVDVETDEKDNFVGIGIAQTDLLVIYLTSLSRLQSQDWSKFKLIGHNLKFDIKLLRQWGLNVTRDNIFADTQLMSYCENTTKESHSLKDLGKELGYLWPTYKDMVGSGRNKQTLDKQDIERVANYCGIDVFVTYKLYYHLLKIMTPFAKRSYEFIELPLMKLLFEMETQGVLIDVEQLNMLDNEFETQILFIRSEMDKIAGKEFNANSNQQTAAVLEAQGLVLPRTKKGNKKVDKWVLLNYPDNPIVKLLLQHNKLEKLWSAYTQSFKKKTTLPYIHTTYNQITKDLNNKTERGISTGRLSSSDPNLQQIPVNTEEGIKMRSLFIPHKGNVLIDADFSQIEYRLLAHLTKEPILINAYHSNSDLHSEVMKVILGTTHITETERKIGKQINFASIYGAQAKKIAKVVGCKEDEAQEFLNRYWQRLPAVTAWVNRTKYQAHQKKGIYTLHKRWIPLPKINDADRYERMHWERAAVNYTIQGSAAEIMKLAMIEIRKKGIIPLLTVHDELLIECKEEEKDVYLHLIKSTMENVVKLDVPLIADIGAGYSWKEAKSA